MTFHELFPVEPRFVLPFSKTVLQSTQNENVQCINKISFSICAEHFRYHRHGVYFIISCFYSSNDKKQCKRCFLSKTYRKPHSKLVPIAERVTVVEVLYCRDVTPCISRTATQYSTILHSIPCWFVVAVQNIFFCSFLFVVVASTVILQQSRLRSLNKQEASKTASPHFTLLFTDRHCWVE